MSGQFRTLAMFYLCAFPSYYEVKQTKFDAISCLKIVENCPIERLQWKFGAQSQIRIFHSMKSWCLCRPTDGDVINHNTTYTNSEQAMLWRERDVINQETDNANSIHSKIEKED